MERSSVDDLCFPPSSTDGKSVCLIFGPFSLEMLVKCEASNGTFAAKPAQVIFLVSSRPIMRLLHL